jgi:hypothetical protein
VQVDEGCGVSVVTFRVRVGTAGLIVGIAVEKLLDAGWEAVESRKKEGDNESRH